MAGCVARRALAVGSRWWSRSLTGARGPRPLCAAGGTGAFLPAATTTRRHLSSRNRPEGKVLETVGVFEVPKQNGKYETGQLFLHSVFGYRGVVLFPWQARLYDRDVASAAPEKAENPAGHGSKEVKGKTHTYYQVLIDARDCPHISQRSQTEAVTFLANHDDSRALYAIPGLDYVSHEDILPYTSTDSGSDTGGYSVYLAPWRQCEAEGWWAGNQCYPRSSLRSSTAATSPCKLPVGICGVRSASRGLMAPTSMSGSLPSPWKAIKMRRHHPQAFTGRPAEALSGQAQSPKNSSHPTIAAELSPSWATMGLLIVCAI
uniref:DNA polymerase delta interacting protein 2 n=1 Tax=Molossus molossus TaxID=27622 RepID=A0A7J8D0W7_MOLMO|nr:DNA polymerase delta interacting protein 2 [Molossus molossus]